MPSLPWLVSARQQATPLDAQSKGEWWAVYHDATLSGLLNQVSISNQNVANYAAQYRQAQALASESRAALFPSLGYDGSATRSGERKRSMMSPYRIGSTPEMPSA